MMLNCPVTGGLNVKNELKAENRWFSFMACPFIL